MDFNILNILPCQNLNTSFNNNIFFEDSDKLNSSIQNNSHSFEDLILSMNLDTEININNNSCCKNAFKRNITNNLSSDLTIPIINNSDTLDIESTSTTASVNLEEQLDLEDSKESNLKDNLNSYEIINTNIVTDSSINNTSNIQILNINDFYNNKHNLPIEQNNLSNNNLQNKHPNINTINRFTDSVNTTQLLSENSLIDIDLDTTDSFDTNLYANTDIKLNTDNANESTDDINNTLLMKSFEKNALSDLESLSNTEQEFVDDNISDSDIMNQIKNGMTSISGNKSLRLQLKPQGLGNVGVNICVTNGKINIRFLVDNTRVENTLLNNLSSLESMLSCSGILALNNISIKKREDNKKNLFNLSNNIEPSKKSESIFTI